jgi:hypothetical protein
VTCVPTGVGNSNTNTHLVLQTCTIWCEYLLPVLLKMSIIRLIVCCMMVLSGGIAAQWDMKDLECIVGCKCDSSEIVDCSGQRRTQWPFSPDERFVSVTMLDLTNNLLRRGISIELEKSFPALETLILLNNPLDCREVDRMRLNYPKIMVVSSCIPKVRQPESVADGEDTELAQYPTVHNCRVGSSCWIQKQRSRNIHI